MKENLFREVSLKRLSSPEQLDMLIKVTSPKAWLALAALCLILAVVIAWSFLGSIPTKVTGRGILLNDGGAVSLSHFASGQVIDLRFGSFEKVKKGDVIARIEQPELVEEINGLLARLAGLEQGGDTDSSEYRTAFEQVERLRIELDNRSRIVSPVNGRILSMNMQEGGMAVAGDTLATLEIDGAASRMEAVLYVSAELAGKIRTGMEVQLSPDIVNKEEYGFMLGRVISIAEYPETEQSMMQTLGNGNLVALLAGQGAPLKVVVDIIPDGLTISGYKWSSPGGAPYAIPGGTLANGAVVVERERPIAKVIPFFKMPESGER